jgi:hypothetical protein
MGINGIFIILLVYFILGLLFVVVLIFVVKWAFNVNGNSRLRKKQYLLLKQIAIKLDVDVNKINEIDSI